MDFTVIVVTYNRADVLGDTLAALSRVSYDGGWQVLVVDNNSNDPTREVVESARRDFPVELQYLFVPEPGKYGALNEGILAAGGRFIAATDDDAYPEPDWLTEAARGFAAYECDFVGGPVHPVWRSDPPEWLNPRDAISGKVLGLQDHGAAPLEYGAGISSWPLGVNVAYRRDAFERAGMFDARLGRVAGTLRNQAQREWHLRARDAGLRGMYLPSMVVHHSVEASRLTLQYFRRWFYWHGVSRAILNRTAGLHLTDPEGLTAHASERHLLGVPSSVWREAARALLSALRRRLSGRRSEAVAYELVVCFSLGVIRQLVSDRVRSAAAPGRPRLGTTG